MEKEKELEWQPMNTLPEDHNEKILTLQEGDKVELTTVSDIQRKGSGLFLGWFPNPKFAKAKKLTWRDWEAVQFSQNGYLGVETPLGFIPREHTSKLLFQKACAVSVVWNEIKRLNDGWEPNWEYGGESKWLLNYFFHKDKTLTINEYSRIQYSENWKYLKSKELVQQLIQNVDTETLKLAFL